MALEMNQVVIAEDDPEICEMIKSDFEQVYNLSVITTDKVDQIIPLVLGTRASVLVMDLELKDGDASQIVADVGAIDGLVVVILTGTWKGRQENLLLAEGAQVVMRKPQKPSTIWQQVLNLRGVKNQHKEKPLRIKIKGRDVFYNVKDGTLVEMQGKRTILADKKREIMDVFAHELASYDAMDEREKRISGGWINRDDLIEQVFGLSVTGINAASSSDIKNSFWYHIREVRKILQEYAKCDPDLDLIETRRAGRSESYYRLNPKIFIVEKKAEEEPEKEGA